MSKPRKLSPAMTLLSVSVGISIVSLAAFAGEAAAVESHQLSSPDRNLALGVHDHLGHGWEWLMNALSTVGSSWAVIGISVLVALLLVLRRSRLSALVVLLAPSLGLALSGILKLGFHRHRPHLWPHPLSIEKDYSFPSGHATAAMALASILTYVIWRHLGAVAGATAAILLVVIAFGVGLSRIYLGVHWPTDVLAGFSLGLFCSSLSIALTELSLPAFVRRLSPSAP